MTSVATPSSGPATPSGNLRARVLVVDDSSTILRVVSRILQRHGYEVACARDGVEGMQQLQVAGPFDLVLLDFVMPRKNGYQFVRELRATEHHRDMPVVLMSARTTAIGDRFVEQTGAVDALSKPFDARALVAVVGGVIAKRAEQVQQGAPAPVLPLPEAMVDEDQLDEKAPESEMHRPSQLGRLDPMTRLIVDAVVPPLRALSPSEFAVPGRIEEAVQRGLQATTAELVEAAAEVCHTVESDEILSGRLSKIPLAEVMQLFQLRRQTGVMEVRHKGRSMTLSIRQGMLDLAQSNELDREFRLGRYLVRNCGITREELPDLIAQVDNEQQLGEWLIQHKRISEEELYRALAHQTCELVYEVLRWPQGSFRLRDIPFSEEAERARLELGLGELALEGFRRVDEWRLMADTVDFNAVLATDRTAIASIDTTKLSPDESILLNAIDGVRTAREVIEFSRLATFDAVKAIFGFIQSRLIRSSGSTNNTATERAGTSTISPVSPLERPLTLRQPNGNSSIIAMAPNGGATGPGATTPPAPGATPAAAPAPPAPVGARLPSAPPVRRTLTSAGGSAAALRPKTDDAAVADGGADGGDTSGIHGGGNPSSGEVPAVSETPAQSGEKSSGPPGPSAKPQASNH